MTAPAVLKTPKLYVNGAFVRSDSGRVYQPDGRTNVPMASRKDLRDAVRAARLAQPGWSARTPYNRGQVIYRVAEMMEARRTEFGRALGGGRRAVLELNASLEALVFFAGLADKVSQMGGSVNGVGGPYFNFSMPQPSGVVFLVAGERKPLSPLVMHLAAAICSGNTTVALVSLSEPLGGLLLAEVLQSGDVPSGAVNLLSGFAKELLPWVGSHRDINLIDCCGCQEHEWRSLAEAAAAGVTRVMPPEASGRPLQPKLALDMTELKTVWHPVGI